MKVERKIQVSPNAEVLLDLLWPVKFELADSNRESPILKNFSAELSRERICLVESVAVVGDVC